MSKQGRDQGVWWLYILQQSVVQSGLLLHGVILDAYLINRAAHI